MDPTRQDIDAADFEIQVGPKWWARWIFGIYAVPYWMAVKFRMLDYYRVHRSGAREKARIKSL